MTTTTTTTQLDFSLFHSSNPAVRAAFCKKLVSQLQQNGFARLTNHGVPASEIDKAFETSRHFFHLPLPLKLLSPHPPTVHPHRGYSAFGIENVSAASATLLSSSPTAVPKLLKDMKESYDIGSPSDPLYGNIWPPPAQVSYGDEFRKAMEGFFGVCYNAELDVLEAISLGLGLRQEGGLKGLHRDGTNELRLTHYPAVRVGEFGCASEGNGKGETGKGNKEAKTRIAAHTDFGSVTLLFQDSVGGLQAAIPPKSSNFIEIESGNPHEIILLVGDCLEKLTGLPACRHRVHLPDALKTEGEEEEEEEEEGEVEARFSIAYFGKPDREASLRPLVEGLVREGVEKYMTAGEFQEMRIQGTY
ncbi:hypothetical protein B0T09DRAFT_305883 [Sordaria sp. MPI-SDFR-AT-0083]|nr:hypothetical protein B0T09DRAFT_305883 [Sordaria sp. MPI-SDFR-AT-0083]